MKNIYGYLFILGMLLVAADTDSLAAMVITKAVAVAILWFSYKKGFAVNADNL